MSMPPPAMPASFRDARSVTPMLPRGPRLFLETPEPEDLRAHRLETPQPDERMDEDLVTMDEDGFDDLIQLTQSFKGRDDPFETGVGVTGNDDVDFDADADGHMGGDADD